MVESNRFELIVDHVVWLFKQLLKGKFVSITVNLLHPRLIHVLPKLWRDWLYARYSWTTCREFNDGPDECYLTWGEYWAWFNTHDEEEEKENG